MSSRRGVLWAVALLWVVGIAVGGWEIYRYETTPGEAHVSPIAWPEDSQVPRPERGPTLVIFIHPECPCSRASMTELREVVRRTHVVPRVVYIGGDGPDVSDIPGAVRIVDRDGDEARRFGATTSGHVVVYRADGTLAFAGGITGIRGHAGDNRGRRSAIAAVTGEDHDADHAVFGCGLFAREGSS